MKFKFLHIAVTASAIALCGNSVAPADELLSKRTPNAALKYWQASGALPQINEGTSARLSSVWDPSTFSNRPGAGLERLLEAARYSLRVTQYGASISDCDWGIDLKSEGAETLLPHLHRARTLSLLLMLRARQQFALKETQGAVRDIITALALGRHVTHDGTLIGFLVGNQIESRAYGVLCGWLDQLDADSLESLKISIAELPTASSVAAGLASEEQFLDWALEMAESGEPGSLLRLCRSLSVTDEKTEALLEAGGRRSDFVRHLNALRPFYLEARKIVELRPEEFAKRHASYLERIGHNPLARFCTADLATLHDVANRHRASRLLMNAAIDLQQHGTEAIASTRDPFGDGPFDFRQHSGGFTLTSAYESKDETPVSITVGIQD